MARARTITVLTLLAAMLALSTAAHAGSKHQRKVYLNGIDLDGVELPEAVFDSCSVKFDARGNIHITAPGFDIAAKPADGKQARPAPPATLSQHYFLVTNETPRGATGYQVGVYVNGEKVTTVRSNAAPMVVDISKWVRPGKNEIRMLASKASGKTGSGKQVLKIQLAEGDAKNGEAIVRKTLLTYQRTAAEKTSFQHRYDFTAR